MKRLLIVLMAAAALALVPVAAAADEGEGDQHFGPFAGASTDSGTCGNNWAADTFTRNFFVHQNADGTFRLIETFSNGKFVTVAGTSPGACQKGSGHGSTVDALINGNFGGFFNGTITGTPVYNPHGCDFPAPCTTTSGFVLAVFGPGARYGCVSGPGSCSFFFAYYAADQGLKYHIWINASSDLGGNRGDIANA
jgi:hypothetical protein